MKYLYPAPLFGQATSFLYAHASENPEERSLISDFLCSTSIVGAVESHQLVCDYLKLIANTRRGALKDYKTVIEKLLLWCFLVKRKSLLDIESGELLIFLDFFESPPESWIAPIGKRFLHSREGTTSNDSWCPFRCQQNDSVWCCPLINHFFSINKVFFGRTVRIPRQARVLIVGRLHFFRRRKEVVGAAVIVFKSETVCPTNLIELSSRSRVKIFIQQA